MPKLWVYELIRLEGAMGTLADIPVTDPLNFRIGNEIYLSAKESGNVQKAENKIADLTKK